MSIHLKFCLCGCRSQRLHNSAPLEPTGDSCLQSFMTLAVQKPRASLLPHAFLPLPFLKCTGHHEVAAMQNFCTKCECATRWNLPACGFRNDLFLSMQGTTPGAGVLVLLFLCWAPSAVRELQCLLDCAYLWGMQKRLVRLAASLSPQMRSQLPCRLRLNLSFPVLVFWFLFRLRAGDAWACRWCNSDPTKRCP